MTNPRFASIGSILSRTATEPEAVSSKPVRLTPEDPAAVPTEVEESTAAETIPLSTPRQRTAPKRPRPPESEKVSGGVRRVAFRLDPALHAALVARAAADHISHGQLVLNSVEAAHSGNKLADLMASGETRQGGGLFPRLPSPSPVQPTVPVEIRLHAQAVVVLDQLAKEHGALSRTQLLVAALRYHLS